MKFFKLLILFIVVKYSFCSSVGKFLTKVLNEYQEISNGSSYLCMVGFEGINLLDLQDNITSYSRGMPQLVYSNRMTSDDDKNITAWKCTMTIVAIKDNKVVIFV